MTEVTSDEGEDATDESTRDTTGRVSVGDHLRARDGMGVYRVVGTRDEVTLLRVTDGEGRRASTGDLRHVDRETLATRFERASDPDDGFHPLRAVRGVLSGLYWDVRRLF